MSLLQSSSPPPYRQLSQVTAAFSRQTGLDDLLICNSYTLERLLIVAADISAAMHPRILLCNIRSQSRRVSITKMALTQHTAPEHTAPEHTLRQLRCKEQKAGEVNQLDHQQRHHSIP